MSVVVNEVRRGAYFDSVALMRIAAAVKALPGIEECGLLMATPANRRILADASVLSDDSRDAGPGDLLIALRARDEASGKAGLAEARRLIDQPKAQQSDDADWTPRTIRSAAAMSPGANLALISVPGVYATAEAMKAIRHGLNVMMFSDNVPVADERELKTAAQAAGVLMMGPDCGTAILGGVPLGFANAVTRGDIGIIGASGTGIQEVSCLVSNGGGGVSHAIGTGGRDLKAEVGGLTTLMAIDLLDADASTRHIVIISKPPDPATASRVLERVAHSAKSFTICFIGDADAAMPANARSVATLEAAALSALGAPVPSTAVRRDTPGRGVIRGLFAGGTLCAEAQVVLRDAGLALASNAGIGGVASMAEAEGSHTLIDLGDDEYTLGRPHPMIEPAVRDAALASALADPACAVLLIDCVLGYGSHADPAGHLVRHLSGLPQRRPVIVASVTGTEADPQRRSAQVRALEAAGIRVAPSNAAAARLALTVWSGRDV